jgi:HSP90 family molecular chaperone
MAQLIDRFKMETNFEGLIQLLAKSLYPEPDVFIRELVQNAHDGLVRRQQSENDVAGRIDIEFDRAKRTLTFRDNGIGMDKQDIRDFISVIGSTGTGSAREELLKQGMESAYQLIGQFGIGMLSAFVVAERVIVRTRKLGDDNAFAWHNSGSTDCELYSDDRAEVGTDIEVFINDQYSFMLDEKRLREVTVKYCDFVQFPIYLCGRGPINTIDAPWHRKNWGSEAEKEASYRAFLNHRYPDVPLDIIPVEIDEPYHARGALYISDRHVPDVNTTGVVDIFVRRMFIRASDNTLLPPWAKFVRGVIDSSDLQPTTARDNIQRKHPSFDFLQRRLGDLVVERLIYLADHEPRKFQQINLWHHYHLKGMACFHDDFFERVADTLLFETNKGSMSLRQYLTKNQPRADRNGKSPIYFFGHKGAAAQFYRLADARGWVVINAGYRFDEQLLEKFAERNKRTVHLQALDSTDDAELFQRLEIAEQERFQQFELDMEVELRRCGLSNVAVQMRRFVPAELPSVIILTPETEAEETLRNFVSQPWSIEGMEEITIEALKQHERRTIFLSLNANNALIQTLASMERKERAIRDVMIGIYNIAILYSQSLLTQSNANAIHEQVVRLLDRLVSQQAELTNISQILEEERRQALDLRDRQIEVSVVRPEYIRMFMITPFAEEFRPLEHAIRKVFETPPYFFEVQLARDYTHTPGLLDNVREHMMQAHGFVAEITDQRPNVMFELGAAMMPDDGRPVFALRRADAKLPVLADFNENLFITYGSLNDPAEKLESAIRSAFERDGRIIHEGITRLIDERKKRFLSRTLLANLMIRLNDKEIAVIMKEYTTVEDFLAVDPKELGRRLSLKDYVVQALLGELTGMS